jgi:hypothetical protein
MSSKSSVNSQNKIIRFKKRQNQMIIPMQKPKIEISSNEDASISDSQDSV